MNWHGFTDWKTTIPFVLAAIASFVVNTPQYFPPLAVDIAKYLVSLGLTVGGINVFGGKKPDA